MWPFMINHPIQDRSNLYCFQPVIMYHLSYYETKPFFIDLPYEQYDNLLYI